MKRKVYTSPGKLSITVNVEGKPQNVSFVGYNPTTKHRLLVTDDHKLQNALEKTSAFNQFFWLDQEFNLEEETPAIMETPVSSQVVVVPDLSEKKVPEVESIVFETLSDAKKWITTGLKEKVYPSMNKEKATALAKSKGYEIKIK